VITGDLPIVAGHARHHGGVDLVIGTATAHDAVAVADLLRELGYEQDGGLADRLRRWADDPAAHVLVARVGNELEGVLAMYLTPRFEREGWWARIVTLVTRQTARRQGVGRRLVHRAEAIATAAGCDTMTVSSSRERVAAQEFYRSMGYRDRCPDHAQFVRSLS
jgi:GNAT superfamily N-acetyltransferase